MTICGIHLREILKIFVLNESLKMINSRLQPHHSGSSKVKELEDDYEVSNVSMWWVLTKGLWCCRCRCGESAGVASWSLQRKCCQSLPGNDLKVSRNHVSCGKSSHHFQDQIFSRMYPFMNISVKSLIKDTLVCNRIVDHSDVVEALPVGAAPTTSSFAT